MAIQMTTDLGVRGSTPLGRANLFSLIGSCQSAEGVARFVPHGPVEHPAAGVMRPGESLEGIRLR